MNIENEKSPHKIIITVIVLALVTVIGYTGFKLYDKKDSGDVKANNDIAVADLNDQISSDASQDNTSNESQSVATTPDDTQNVITNTNKPAQTPAPALTDQNNTTPPATTNPPVVTPPVVVPPVVPDPIDNTKPIVPAGFILADFENGTLENWNGSGAIADPGYKSNHAMKLSSPALDSTAAKRIIETPILKGFEKVEFDIKAATNSVLPGDASAFSFEQNGEWKWVSLASYVNASNDDWQHIAIPLTDFAGLDTTKNVSNLTIRLWSVTENDYYFDNITLTGTTEATILKRPNDLTGTVVSDSRIDLSWTGNASQFNVYKDDNMIATVNEPVYSVTSLNPQTGYKFYVTATDGTNESTPSESINLTTSAPIVQKLVIADFEDGTSNGFGDNGTLVQGYNSTYALSLTNPENGAIGIEKVFDSVITKDHKYLEFDINVNGTYFDDDSATIVFDQNGWIPVSIMPYIDGRSSDWQHVKIPLSDFAGLNTDNAVARMIFRFWNYTPATVNIDNIAIN